MSYVHVQNLFGYLVLFSLFQTVKTDCDDVEHQTFKKSFGETGVKVSNTSDLTPSPFDIDIKTSMRYFEFNESLQTSTHRNEVSAIKPRRKPRFLINGTVQFEVNCLSCISEITSTNWDCYSGNSIPSKRCGDAEHCFIELNPQYIKRGCVLPGRVNRTFLCKCPLCNDKPSYDVSHYEYKEIDDWEFDNERLLTPMVGMDLMCKVCETKGTNLNSDKHCRFGKNADYMVCPETQLCYTNIDDEVDFVSRGCTGEQMFNSIYFFCNYTRCNKDWYPNPLEKKTLRAIHLRSDMPPKVKQVSSFGSKTCITYFCLMCMIISIIIQCI